MPITASLPRGRPIASAAIGCGARAMAQVARRDLRFGTTSAPSGPAAASAAPSATPQQPVARNVASECWVSRGVSASRREAGKNRAGFDLVRIGDMPGGWRLVEGDAKAYIPGGGYRGNAAGQLGDSSGQRISAAMPADQRHRDRPVLGDRDDRRLFPLGGEEGRDRADQDTAGADTDNRPARLEQPADMSR